MNKTYIFATVIAMMLGLVAMSASAQDSSGDAAADGPVQPDNSIAITADGPVQPSEKMALAEAPGQKIHSVGLRLRWIFLPKWMITMFGVDIAAKNEKHPLVSNLGFGVEYTFRKDNFDITAAIWGAQLDWEDPIYFKNGGEPNASWTEVRNGMSALLFTADFIWSSPITDMIAITYGVGIGMGITIGGDIVQTEAYIDGDGELVPCDGPGNPGTIAENGQPFCEGDGEYHDVYDKLPVVPWINVLAGVRIKPHPHMVFYVDGGFGIGFQMGIRGGYIF